MASIEQQILEALSDVAKAVRAQSAMQKQQPGTLAVAAPLGLMATFRLPDPKDRKKTIIRSSPVFYMVLRIIDHNDDQSELRQFHYCLSPDDYGLMVFAEQVEGFAGFYWLPGAQMAAAEEQAEQLERRRGLILPNDLPPSLN